MNDMTWNCSPKIREAILQVYLQNQEIMELKKYKLGDLAQVTRGASLSGEYYATQGNYIRLTCGNFDYRNHCCPKKKSWT